MPSHRLTDPDRLLERIATLTEDELLGWIWGVSVLKRAWFDGERAALMSRARDLGVSVAV